MFQEIIKAYPKGKCTKIKVLRKGGFFSPDRLYNLKIYTTIPRQKVPTEESDFKEISKQVLSKDWNELETKDKQGYTHRTNLKSYPGLIILIKEIKENE